MQVAQQSSSHSQLAQLRRLNGPDYQEATKPKLALDSLNPNAVSTLHILQGKIKTIDRISDFQRDLDELQDNTKQLALLRLRQEELRLNIPKEQSRAENFSSVDNMEVLNNISSVLESAVNFRIRNLQNKSDNLKKNSPFNPVARRSKQQIITDSFAKVDAIQILDAHLESGNYNLLIKSARELTNKNNPDLVQSISNLSEALRTIHERPNLSQLQNLNNEIRSLIVQGKYNEANDLYSTVLIDPLSRFISQSSYSNDLSNLFHYLSKVPQENLETMGYFFPSTPLLFSPQFIRYLRKSGSNESFENDHELEQSLTYHRRRLWDTGISWDTAANHESDIRLIATTYATIKRLSILTSSLQVALEEIELNPDDLDKRQKREALIDSYWELYYDTKDIVLEESRKALSNRSLNEEETQLTLAPYENIITILEQIPRGGHHQLYLKNEGDEQDPLNNSFSTFQRSTNGINGMINSLSNIIDIAGAGTGSVNEVLQIFVNDNRHHPEQEKIIRWSKSFPARFSVLGVPWYNIN